MRWLERGILAALLGLSACLNFDDAYSMFCDGGRCGTAATDGGPRLDSGVMAADSGTRADGGPDAGSAASDAGSSATDAGPAATDAGSAKTDAGASPCRAWGQSCTGGDCCAVSDAGVLQACGRNNLCQEYAADCKESGFDCTANHDCCGESCVSGRCAVCQPQDGPCTKATDCCPGYSCAATGLCTYAPTRLPDGDRCNSSGQCTNGFCDPADGGPHNGICKTAPGCGNLGSTAVNNCCEGLVGDAGNKCCQSDKDWCEYDSDCCSGSCLGRRCTRATSAALGDRCWSAPECAGLLPICNPVGLTCTEHICLPAGVNLFSGCCGLQFSGGCRFPDGSSCGMGGVLNSNPSTCCSGQTSSGKCTNVTYF